MLALSERQKLILALVIRDFIETAQPVGSFRLVDHYGLEFSSATVRNEMAALTDAGYLRQPHTSAGREPTEDGYRYFVRQLMGHTELPLNTRRTITHQFYQARQDVNQWLHLAASVLAFQSQGASLVTAPHPEQARFKHIELIGTHGRQVLMVLVMNGGEVHQQMLMLGESVTQEQLSEAANSINHRCQGLSANIISTLTDQANALEQDIYKLTIEAMQRSTEILSGEVYRDGINNVLAEPEFAEAGIAHRALRVLEERSLLEDLLSRTILLDPIGGIQVLIGGEGTLEELRDCSVVLSRYGVAGMATGTLGVFGPIRMSYGRTISTVRFVADLLSDLVEEMHIEKA